MPTFAYRAYLPDGSPESGAVKAASRQEAAVQLQLNGRQPYYLSLTSDSRAKTGFLLLRRTGRSNFARIFGELSLLLEAGFTVDKALYVVVEKEPSQTVRRNLLKVLELVTEGKSVSEAFSLLPDIPAEITPILASGERSGRIAHVTDRLARIFDARAKRRSAILDALTYPAFLVLVMIGALMILSAVLIPAIEPMFDGAKVKPLAIRMLSPLGDLLMSLAPIAPLAVLLFLLAALIVSKSRRIKDQLATLLTMIPVSRSLIRRISAIRYLETLSLQLGNGVPMAEALHSAGAVVSNRAIALATNKITDEVANGVSLGQAMQNSGMFDRATLSLVSMGEEANRLSLVLDKASVMLEATLTRRIERGMALLTPALTVILGLIIGSLVLSVMTTILSVNDLALPG